jgi:hypothetical protein
MQTLTLVWEAEMRFIAAPVLLAIGLVSAGRGVRYSYAALRLPVAAKGKNVRLMASFRAAITGLAVTCIAVGWLLQVPALAVTAAIIGLGELFETSVDVWALRRSEAGATPWRRV